MERLRNLPRPCSTTLAKLIQTQMIPWLLSIPLAYLLGSIPFGYLLVRVFRHQDIRSFGSGNIGATNVARSGGKALGIATLLLDLGKAFAAVTIIRYLVPAQYDLAAAAAFAAVLGHCFPLWLRFRGGKGVASAFGAVLALTWPTALCLLGVFAVVFLLTRYVSLASVLAAASLPLFALHFVAQRSPWVVACIVLIPLLIIFKHHTNLSRLLAGTESRFGSPKAAA